MANDKLIDLSKLKGSEVPERLRVSYYYNFKEHPFRHQDLFQKEGINSVVAVLGAVHDYAQAWMKNAIAEKMKSAGVKERKPDEFKGRSVGYYSIFVEEGAVFEPGFIKGSASLDKKSVLFVGKGSQVLGVNLFLDEGDIYIGENNIIEPGVGIKGPTIIGNKNEIRQGAYFRGDIIIGDNGTFRGELKNAVMMDKANFPHPSYVGDSICGYGSHFGNQATTANLGLYAGIFGKKNVKMEIDGKVYDLGRPKIGIILGDFSQIGCNSVSDPGVFVAPNTIVYQLSRISKGFYGPLEVLKNKPMEHGIIERSPLRK